ncbi:FlgM family anti-sigma-28 factor [Trinickia symbiotica]|uniref:Negative regulator of flagellin synthesis n=1 Tax=Trinickia symbiotica TaxID=863227 RepID=A0A2N7WN12_9BURK|nr:flagellar biosynthesis anti-sigma factor FlgM [Trinickia symbiotica]PMS30813.1 flagellar biosynthesis anti-sigma factor FlgM [Trinickia symbiotica]PPK41518.1 FlgM family anti-sigma-28 factor [Trinickia symbiotica]
MKVDSSTSSSLSSTKGGVQGTRQGGAAGGTGAANAGAAYTPATSGESGGDANVSLSGLSSQLHALATSGAADIDVAQVESIKQAIKDGTLTIDTGKIADGILETARNLLQATQSSGG